MLIKNKDNKTITNITTKHNKTLICKCIIEISKNNEQILS